MNTLLKYNWLETLREKFEQIVKFGHKIVNDVTTTKTFKKKI